MHYRRVRRTNHLATISLNLMMTLCASNFVFIVGVQSSRNFLECETIAALIHFFHLATAIWCLNHSFAIYDFVINDNAPVMRNYNMVAYIGSALFVVVNSNSKLKNIFLLLIIEID